MSERTPLVWCLLGRKAGDNTQVRALAEELGFGFEEKLVIARPWELLAHLGERPTLAGIDRAASSALAPPWPDLVISAGRRNEPVARWIRQRSAGRTRLVHIGRPWAPLDEWDLVVTTPQYFLPRQANIHHNSLPLLRLAPAEVASAARELQPRIAALPRPWIAVLAGATAASSCSPRPRGAASGNWRTASPAGAAGRCCLPTARGRPPRPAMPCRAPCRRRTCAIAGAAAPG